jgi:hypothetical protein
VTCREIRNSGKESNSISTEGKVQRMFACKLEVMPKMLLEVTGKDILTCRRKYSERQCELI